jgi:hypothetical protein
MKTSIRSTVDNDGGDGGLTMVIIYRKGGWDWVMGGRSEGDGDNRYGSESWIFYMRKDLSFIGQESLGLDFGPSFPVQRARVVSHALRHSTSAVRQL